MVASSCCSSRTLRDAGPAQLGRADLCAAARLWPVNARTAVVRSSQRLGDDSVVEANSEGLARAWRGICRRENAPVADANSRDRRSRGRVVRRAPRARKVETELDNEIAEAQGERLLCITGPADVERARVSLPASGKGGERRFVA